MPADLQTLRDTPKCTGPWHAFVTAAFPDPVLRAYAQYQLGRAVYGEVPKLLLVLFGPGPSGKTTLERILRATTPLRGLYAFPRKRDAVADALRPAPTAWITTTQTQFTMPGDLLTAPGDQRHLSFRIQHLPVTHVLLVPMTAAVPRPMQPETADDIVRADAGSVGAWLWHGAQWTERRVDTFGIDHHQIAFKPRFSRRRTVTVEAPAGTL